MRRLGPLTTLRVIVDEVINPAPSGVSLYARELTRALIAHAPPRCAIEGIVAASTEPEYAALNETLPKLSGLHKSALARRELQAAWQHGFTIIPGGGMIHAPSLLAPLWRRDTTRGQQTVVTVHDVTAWTHPESMPSRTVGWHKAMVKRAHKYADAIVAPTHSVAEHLAGLHDFGDRVHVVSAAPTASLKVGDDAPERAAALGLPYRYLLAIGGLEGIHRLIAALAFEEAGELPLVIVGSDDDGQLAAAVETAGVDEARVRILGELPEADYAVALARATALVLPSYSVGFGVHVLDAFRLGTPVIHSDIPSVVDIAGDAGLPVAADDAEQHPKRLAEAIELLASDSELSTRLVTTGKDRAGLFSWVAAAEKVWHLHADL